MTKIQNSKQLAFDLIGDLDIVIWNLFGQILRSGGACNLLFPVYPDLDLCRVLSDDMFLESELFQCFQKVLEFLDGIG